MVETVPACCSCDWTDKVYVAWIGGDVASIIDVETRTNTDNFVSGTMKRCIGWVDANVWCTTVASVRSMEEVTPYTRKPVSWSVMNNC